MNSFFFALTACQSLKFESPTQTADHSPAEQVAVLTQQGKLEREEGFAKMLSRGGEES